VPRQIVLSYASRGRVGGAAAARGGAPAGCGPNRGPVLEPEPPRVPSRPTASARTGAQRDRRAAAASAA